MAESSGALRFPVAHEFSPGQVVLPDLLDVISLHSGERDAIVEAIRARYFAEGAQKRTDPEERRRQQRTRANNVLWGMGPNGYQLFRLDTNGLTDMGTALLGLDEEELYRAFARHILTSCHGMVLLDCVRSLTARGDGVTKASLATELRALGYEMPNATTHHLTMLNWLAMAGVVNKKREIDEQRLSSILGFEATTAAEWRALSSEQRAFLRALRSAAELNAEALVPTKDVLRHAVIEHGPIFREDQLRARVTQPLADAGWLQFKVKAGGRGAKSGEVRATAKLLDLDLELVSEDRVWGVPPDLRPKLDTPLAEIQRDLDNPDTYTKGIALELLAARIASDLTLTLRAFRLRGVQTGGAEVDLIAEAAHLHFSRWLFQCKNVKGAVPLSDLAKEVGMAVMLRAHVIVMVTTSGFSSAVTQYARELMESNYLQVVLVDNSVIASYGKHGRSALLDYFHATAAQVMSVKRIQLSGSESDA